jgi:hypothetical protein
MGASWNRAGEDVRRWSTADYTLQTHTQHLLISCADYGLAHLVSGRHRLDVIRNKRFHLKKKNT